MREISVYKHSQPYQNQSVEVKRQVASDERMARALQTQYDQEDKQIKSDRVYAEALQASLYSDKPASVAKRVFISDSFKPKSIAFPQDFYTIKQDGNCCFRSAGHGLLEALVRKEVKIEDLRGKLTSFNGDCKVQLRKLVDLLERCKKNNALSSQDSNDLASILRALACAYNENPKNFKKGEYLFIPQEIQEMKKDKVWGGYPELHALSEILEIRFNIKHPKYPISLIGQKGPLISLGYNGSHYSLIQGK